MNADGSDVTRLTFEGGVLPTLSPDGSSIAFTSYRDGNGEIYVMNADGSNQTRLTNHPGFDGRVSWSPDGSRIAYASNRDGVSEVYAMNADGSNQTFLATSAGTPAWSPDGSRIAVLGGSPEGREEIYIMNADGTNITRITTQGGRSPDWSPDGSRIAFHSGRDRDDDLFDIYVMNADGSNQTQLTTQGGAGISGGGFPDWSPDGAQIAFVSVPSDGNPSDYDPSNQEIYVMNADGSNVTRLTNNTAFDGPPSWGP
jgi:Tol biopolymer transport system component